ncbi:MAG: Kelch motif protein [Acidobacteriales bacterium]|nr:Kelch motif protein [Terriglobales bacterium]
MFAFETRLGCVLLLIISVGCGGGAGTPPPALQPSPISVSISPVSATPLLGTSVSFTAQVTGTSNTGVSYSVVEGNAGGSIAANGIYLAPSQPGTFHVRATSIADPARSMEAIVTVRGYTNSIARLPNPREAYDHHTATLMSDGSVLLVGGAGFSTVHKQTERYQPSQNVFEIGPSLATARLDHSAILLANGDLLVSGGYNPVDGSTSFDPAFRSSELLVANTSFFAAGPDMNFPRRNHVFTMLKDGRVLVTGGIQLRGTGFSATPNTELYDPAANQFVAGDRMNSPRWMHSATLLADGRVLLVGGRDNNCTGVGCPVYSLNTAELFDPATGKYTTTGSLNISRYAHSAALLDDGRVLILGGETTENIGPTDQVTAAEVYNPATGTFAPFGNIIFGRGFHALARLNSGKYLLAGGYNENGSPSPTTEIFDPETGTSTAGPDMSDWRIRAAAVKLKTGEVLIVGGNNSGGPVLPVDLYK